MGGRIQPTGLVFATCALIKRHRVGKGIRKQDPYRYTAYKRPTSDQKTEISKGIEKDYFQNRLSNEGCNKGQRRIFIMIKELIQQDITLLNIYTPNVGAPKYTKQILIRHKGRDLQ